MPGLLRGVARTAVDRRHCDHRQQPRLAPAGVEVGRNRTSRRPSAAAAAPPPPPRAGCRAGRDPIEQLKELAASGTKGS